MTASEEDARRWQRLIALADPDREDPEAGGFLESPALALAGPLLAKAPRDGAALGGSLVGPYRILRELARGGMGAVYLAERADGQFEQRVALKLIKRGMDSDDIHRRFLGERQILARLSHPHIARLLDGGVSADGQPYFAMEYVNGVPLTAYCDERRLAIPERLKLFADVCQAVRHAHQNLIIHRDLKPSNILVTVDGQVKLLDFGIAKLVHQDSAAGAAFTEVGSRAMTPEYAAPEQVRGEPVTTATDVYALGAILYELLTGHRAHRLQRRTLQELEQVICERTPEPPSSAVSRTEEISLANGVSETVTPDIVSSARGTESARLRKLLGGDLDTIVLKALQKAPTRRYSSADALLADIQRYEAGLPVLARPDSRLYRAGKFVRRHRLGVGAASALLVALLAGLIGTTWQARVASREATKANEVKNFVKDLFNVATPNEARGREITAREMLERGTRRVDSALARQPEVQLELLNFLAQVHRDLGYLDRADSLVRRSLKLSRRLHGTGGLAEAKELATWGTVLIEQGEYLHAESVLTAALAIRQRISDPEDSALAISLGDLAVTLMDRGEFDRAEPLLRQSLAISRRRYPTGHMELSADLDNLGNLMWRMGRFAEADSFTREALEMRERLLPADHPLVVNSLHNLAGVQFAIGNLEDAERLERDALARDRKLYPTGHPDLAFKLQQLDQILEARGRYAEGDSALTQALAIRRKWLGPQHPSTMETLTNVGVLQYRMGHLAAAETAMREGLAYYRKTLGPEHPTTLVILQNLGGILSDEGKYSEAEPLLREGLTLRVKVLGDSNPDVGRTMRQLGLLLQRKSQLAEAESLLRRAVGIERQALPAGHPFIGEALSTLGSILTDRGRPAEAEPMLQEALTIRREKHGPTDPRTLETQSILGACLAQLHRYSEAEPLLLQSFQALRANSYSGKELPGATRRLADYYESRGRRGDAVKVRATLSAHRQTALESAHGARPSRADSNPRRLATTR
jgi:eukaryotic-like serine/threonine-protein kinase